MDEEYTQCVQRVFVSREKGLIYRGKRGELVPEKFNRPDEEVIMKEQNSQLFYFKVQVVEEPGTWLEIAPRARKRFPATQRLR